MVKSELHVREYYKAMRALVYSATSWRTLAGDEPDTVGMTTSSQVCLMVYGKSLVQDSVRLILGGGLIVVICLRTC